MPVAEALQCPAFEFRGFLGRARETVTANSDSARLESGPLLRVPVSVMGLPAEGPDHQGDGPGQKLFLDSIPVGYWRQ